jgi:DNA repair exonuclease SbcCD ATPase subunit
MKLKSLALENFKGVYDFTFDVKNDLAKIFGPNASGKTTIVDAFTWLLFDKDSTWATKFNVRRLDENGNPVNNTVITVKAVIVDNNGEEHTIQKQQKQNWVTKRGTTVAELKGNLNSYEIDGFPKTERDYKEFVSGICPEETFKICSSVTYFMSLPWKDRRKMLTDTVTVISDYDLAVKLGGFDTILEDLKHGTTDDCQRKYNKAAKELKKQQLELPTRVDEVRRSLSHVDVAPLKTKIGELTSELEALKAVKDDTAERFIAIERQIADLQNKANNIVRDAEKACHEAVMEATQAVNAKTREASDATNRVEFYKHIKETSENSKKRLEAKFELLRTKFNEAKGLTFNADEAGKALCPTCGRTVTPKMVEKAKAEYERKLEESKNAINREAKGIQKDIKDCDEQIKTSEAEIAKYEAIAKAATKEAKALQRKLDKLPREADVSGNKDLKAINAKIDALVAERKDLNTKKSADNDFRIVELEAEILSLKSEIASADNTAKEKRIKELEEEQMNVEGTLAHVLQQQDELMSFVQQKMDYIGAEINKRFKTVRFKLFDKQINGGISEVCEATVNGVPYADLNSGHRIIAGLEIAKAFQDIYSFQCPVFIDNAESLSTDNIPKVDGQLILLSVADGELRVE